MNHYEILVNVPNLCRHVIARIVIINKPSALVTFEVLINHADAFIEEGVTAMSRSRVLRYVGLQVLNRQYVCLLLCLL